MTEQEFREWLVNVLNAVIVLQTPPKQHNNPGYATMAYDNVLVSLDNEQQFRISVKEESK